MTDSQSSLTFFRIPIHILILRVNYCTEGTLFIGTSKFPGSNSVKAPRSVDNKI